MNHLHGRRRPRALRGVIGIGNPELASARFRAEAERVVADIARVAKNAHDDHPSALEVEIVALTNMGAFRTYKGEATWLANEIKKLEPKTAEWVFARLAAHGLQLLSF